jgi:putative transcriptional regulator
MKQINRLKAALAEQNRTSKWLAEQIERNEATVSRWCSNKSQPSMEMLYKISQFLNVDIKDLLVSTIKR